MARAKAAAKSPQSEREVGMVQVSAQDDLALVRRAPWLLDPWQRFLSMQQQGRLPHGLLISGDRGLGTLPLARSICAYLLCADPVTQPGEEAPCGVCAACRLRQAGTHPDILFLAVEASARDIPVEPIRGLIEAFSLTRYGALRVALIEQAERMNRHAVNSLLKLLEEPPSGSLFVLTAERPDLLPSTIRSRTQRLTVATPGRAQLTHWLGQMHQLTESEAELLWFVGGGALVAGQPPSWDWQGVTHALIGLLEGGVAPLDAAKNWQAVDREILARWLLRLWIEIQRVHLGLACEAPQALCPAIERLARARPADYWLKRHATLLAFLQTAAHPLNEELARERLVLDLIDPALPARLA